MGNPCLISTLTAQCAQGMSLLDFFYLRDTVLPAAKSQPSPGNTLLAPEPGEAVGKVRLAGKELDGLQAKLDAVAAEPVAYLGKSLFLTPCCEPGTSVSTDDPCKLPLSSISCLPSLPHPTCGGPQSEPASLHSRTTSEHVTRKGGLCRSRCQGCHMRTARLCRSSCSVLGCRARGDHSQPGGAARRPGGEGADGGGAVPDQHVPPVCECQLASLGEACSPLAPPYPHCLPMLAAAPLCVAEL